MKKRKKLLVQLLLVVFVLTNLMTRGVYGAEDPQVDDFAFVQNGVAEYHFAEMLDFTIEKKDPEMSVYAMSLIFLNAETLEQKEIKFSQDNSNPSHLIPWYDQYVNKSMGDGRYILKQITASTSKGDLNHQVESESSYEHLSFQVKKDIMENTFYATTSQNGAEFEAGDTVEIEVSLPHLNTEVSMLAVTVEGGGVTRVGTYSEWYGNLSYDEARKVYTVKIPISHMNLSGLYSVKEIALSIADELIAVSNDGLGSFETLTYHVVNTLAGYRPEFAVKTSKTSLVSGDTLRVEMIIDEKDELTTSAYMYFQVMGGKSSYELPLKRVSANKLIGEMKIHKYFSEGVYKASGISLLHNGESYGSVHHREGEVSQEYQNLSGADFTVINPFSTEGMEFKVLSEKPKYSQKEEIKLSVTSKILDAEYFDYYINILFLENLDTPDTDYIPVWLVWDREEKKLTLDESFPELKPGRYTLNYLEFSKDWSGYDVFTYDLPKEVLFTVMDPLLESTIEISEKLDKEEALALKDEIDALEDTPANSEIKEAFYTALQNIYKVEKVTESTPESHKPSFTTTLENLKALQILEALEEDVTSIDIKLEAELVKKEDLKKYEEHLPKNKSIVALYNLGLMKIVTKEEGETSSGKIANEDIKGMLTLQMPVPEEYLSDESLTVVYVNEEGIIEELLTEIITIDGVKYLQFQTDHFSLYGILAEGTLNEEVPDVEEPGEEPQEEPSKPVEEETNVEDDDEDPSSEDSREDQEEDTDSSEAVDKLPDTGAESTIVYSMTGILVLSAGIILFQEKKRKRAL